MYLTEARNEYRWRPGGALASACIVCGQCQAYNGEEMLDIGIPQMCAPSPHSVRFVPYSEIRQGYSAITWGYLQITQPY